MAHDAVFTRTNHRAMFTRTNHRAVFTRTNHCAVFTRTNHPAVFTRTNHWAMFTLLSTVSLIERISIQICKFLIFYDLKPAKCLDAAGSRRSIFVMNARFVKRNAFGLALFDGYVRKPTNIVIANDGSVEAGEVRTVHITACNTQRIDILRFLTVS